MSKNVDPPILSTRELLYAARDLIKPEHAPRLSPNERAHVQAMIGAVVDGVAAIARIVATAHGCTVTTWADPMVCDDSGAHEPIDYNEARFDGSDKKLAKLAAYEGAL